MKSDESFTISSIEPERLALIEKTLSPRRIFWPAYTWPAKVGYPEVWKRKKVQLQKRHSVNEADLKERTEFLFDKVYAAFYHLEMLKASEAMAIELGNELNRDLPSIMQGRRGTTAVPYEPVGYEYESFLTSVKSALDMLTLLVACSLGRKDRDIYSLWASLRDGRQLKPLPKRIFRALRKHEPMIERFTSDISRRNFAVHKGSLPIGVVNVAFNYPEERIFRTKALNPHAQGADFDYETAPQLLADCEDLFYEMCDLVIAVLGIVYATRFKTGSRMSLQEEMELQGSQTTDT